MIYIAKSGKTVPPYIKNTTVMGEFGKNVVNALSSGFTGGLSSLAGSFGSAAGGLINQLFAGRNARREHEYFQKRADIQQQKQLEIMDQQQKQAIEMWNMQNEYNKPAAVADRYRAAGINPLSAFGGGPVGLGASSMNMPSATPAYGSGASASAGPGAVDPSSVALAGANIVEKLGNLDVSRANVDGLNLLRQSERALNFAKKLVSDQERDNLKQLHDFLDEKNPIELDTARQTLKNAQEMEKQIKSETALNEQETKNKAEALEGITIANAIASVQLAIIEATGMQKANAEIAEIYANVRYLDAKAAEAKQNKDNAYFDMLMKPVKLNLEYVNTMVTAAEAFSGISLDAAQRDNLVKKTENIDVENAFKAVDLFIDAWDKFVNSSKDRESRDKNASEKSKSDARSALSGILKTVLFAIITKGK